MFGPSLRIAADPVRRLLTTGWHGARALWDWYCELGHGDTCEARGLRLLREWLSPAQLAQFEAHKYFDVTGSHSGKRYRIRHGTGTNVHELDDAGRLRDGWCFVPRDCLVAGDVMLAQKIALETDEPRALAIARRFSPRWSPV
jgi:hypothetical protein